MPSGQFWVKLLQKYPEECKYTLYSMLYFGAPEYLRPDRDTQNLCAATKRGTVLRRFKGFSVFKVFKFIQAKSSMLFYTRTVLDTSILEEIC